MLIENGFSVLADEQRVWDYVLDIEKVAPCLPGAELTEVVDDHTWKGRVNVRFGPVAVAFAGTVTMTERDDAARRVTLAAKGTEQRGKGTATATVTSWLEPGPRQAETTLRIAADVTLTGAVAQLTRGLLPEVARQLTGQFADCLQAGIRAEEETAPSGAGVTAAGLASGRGPDRPAAARRVNGIGLALSALWARLVGLVRRLLCRP